MSKKFYVLCYPNQKRPIGDDWGHNTLTAEEVVERLATKPDLNVGILLGPETGLIDVECDSETATARYTELFGDIRTPCWSSKRGRHYLFRHDARLAERPGTMKLKPSGLEFRLGNGKQIQSVIPPSVVDGVKRDWIVSMDECEPAQMPEFVIHRLLLEPCDRAAPQRRESSAASASPELLKRAQQYVAKCDGVPEGGRNSKAFSIAGHCFKFVDEATGARLNENQIVNLLRVWNDKNSPGLADAELRQCAISAMNSSSPRPDEEIESTVRLDDLLDSMRQENSPPATDQSTVSTIVGFEPKEIEINHELHRMVEQGIEALGHAPNTYQYGQALVEVVHDAKKPKQCLHDNGSPQLVPIPKPTLATRLSAWARWEKLLKTGWKSTTPPDTVVSAIHVANNWPSVPVITGIVSCPVLRADGSIVTTPGYDRETGLFLEKGESYPALMQPAEAIKLLVDVVHDFPFETEAHRSGWVAFLITMLARPAFAGSTPFFLFDANSPRTGKGLITDVTTMIVEGRKACRYSWSKDNEETRKLITTVGMSGAPYLLWDNIKGKLGGPALEQMMTTGVWADRLLSLNRQVSFPIRFISAGTSNNARLSRDMTGRTCHSYLKTDLENPEERSDFRHPDILGYVKQHRPELVMAALSIPAAYIAAGRPDQHLTAWGGFETWSDLVRGSIAWAGMPDPGETRAKLRERTDDESGLLLAILQAWPTEPVTIAQAIKLSKEHPALGDILAELPERDRTKELGYLLRDARGRVIGGKRLEGTDTKPVKWRVLEA